MTRRTDGTDGTSGTTGIDGTTGTPPLPSWIAGQLSPTRPIACVCFSLRRTSRPERWGRLREGALRFASDWAAEAIGLGWSLDELFATAEPFANSSLQGAAWFVGKSSVVGVSAAAVTLRTPGGATQRIYRRSLQ